MKSFIKLPLTRSAQIAKFQAQQRITFPQRETLLQKLFKLRMRPSEIDIIADFDHTLTQHRYGQLKCDSLFGMFVRNNNLKHDFKKELLDNYQKYGPYETDASLSYQQKLKYMDLLYTNQRNLFEKHGLTVDHATEVLEQSQLVYRAHIKELLQEIVRSGMQLHIVSGGISDMIYSSLLQIGEEEAVRKAVDIHSNQLEVVPHSQQGLLRFTGNIIHSFNKHTVMAKHPRQRQNSILLGDLKSDIYMALDAGYQTVLSVFYGKEGEFDQRALAESKFDVIIEGDSSHKMVVELMKIIRGNKDVDWRYLYNVDPILTNLVL